MIGANVAVLVLAVQIFAVGTVLQHGREQLDHHGVAIAFVAAQGFANAAQGGQCRVAAANLLQRLAAVAGDGLAVPPDYRARMHVLANAGVIFDLAVLGDGGGAVDEKVKVHVGWNAYGQRIGAEHTLHTKGGRHRGAGVGAGDADAAGLGGHGGVITGNAVVAAVAHGHHAHTVFLGLINGHLHGPMADHLTHAVVAVYHGGGGGFL